MSAATVRLFSVIAALALATTACWPHSEAPPVAPRARPGQLLRDCPDCPAMIVIPGGTFTMGSPENEPDRRRFEGPLRQIAVPAFALGRTEVTRGEYAAFVRATNRPDAPGCLTAKEGANSTGAPDPQATWRQVGFEQTDDHPVVCVSWQDARDYAAWLSAKTGRAYRLPSEAEWEYAARAGTTSAYYWGDSVDRGCGYMNGGDRSLARAIPTWMDSLREARDSGHPRARLIDCDDGAAFTAAVGRYQPNSFGLHDMIGNVWEFVDDCWHEAPPADARSHREPGCELNTYRGGAWDDDPTQLRAARRTWIAMSYRGDVLGLRVARDIE